MLDAKGRDRGRSMRTSSPSPPFAQIASHQTFEKWDQQTYSDTLYINCNFEGDLYPSPRFERCRFYRCSFGLRGRTRFIGANFVQCEISRCHFCHVELSATLFEDCSFLHNEFDHSTVLEEIRLV